MLVSFYGATRVRSFTAPVLRSLLSSAYALTIPYHFLYRASSGVGGYLFCGSGTITITNTLSGLVNGIGITAGASFVSLPCRSDASGLLRFDAPSALPPNTHAGAGIGTMLMAGWLVRTNNLTVGISLILVRAIPRSCD